MQGALSRDPARGLNVVRGEAVGLLEFPPRAACCSRTGTRSRPTSSCSRPATCRRGRRTRSSWLYDTTLFVPDPWAIDAFDGLAGDAPVMLLGTGLTMVDVALKLAGLGHTGKMLAISRRGYLLSRISQAEAGRPFPDAKTHGSPLALMRMLRDETREAEAKGIPWQRVMDAMRPAVARVWASWTTAERAQFLRHLRPRWDVHRHRSGRASPPGSTR